MPTPERDDSGRFPAFAWPGGYPILYMLGDCEPLCAACANGENGSEASVDHEDTQWRIVSADVYWQGPPTQCAHCNASIESAYGDPDNPDD